MNKNLPLVAIILGVAGLIPFVGCGIASVSTADNQAIPALAALIAYSAVILSFLGGVVWGFLLAPHGTDPLPARPARGNLALVLGVIPSLLGWAAMVVAQMAGADTALAILIAAFIATMVTEWQWFRHQLYPAGYIWMRVALTLVVLLTLVTVLTLHLLGAKIIL
jgi:hypothetical protein